MTQYVPTCMEQRKDLATRMRVLRAEHRLSQSALAKLVGVTRNTVSRIETHHPACGSTLDALEEVLEGLER